MAIRNVLQSRQAMVEYLLNLAPLLSEEYVVQVLQAVPTEFVAFIERLAELTQGALAVMSRSPHNYRAQKNRSNCARPQPS